MMIVMMLRSWLDPAAVCLLVVTHDDVIDDVDVLGESGPVYSKRDLYERGHVAVCSHRQVF